MTVSSNAPVIEFDRVRKEYDGRAVVDDLSLRVEGGRIHCLLGPNGAGKTTTMHMLMGLRHPTSGEIRVDGISTASPEIRLARRRMRSEEHTSELQSRENLVCRLLLEKKKET